MHEHDREALVRLSQVLSSSATSSIHETPSSNGGEIIEDEVCFLIHFGNLLSKIMRRPHSSFSSSSSQEQEQEHDDGLNTRCCGNEDDTFTNLSIDPSSLYDCLLSFKINSSVPGDAAASLRSLIEILRKSIEYICDCDKGDGRAIGDTTGGGSRLGLRAVNNDNNGSDIDMLHSINLDSLRSSLAATFWNGTMKQQIQGCKTRIVTTASNDSNGVDFPHFKSEYDGRSKIIISRSKPMKERPLPSIMPLPIKAASSDRNNNDIKKNEDLITIFNQAIVEPQRINGYSNWDDMDEGDYNEEEQIIIIDDSGNDSDDQSDDSDNDSGSFKHNKNNCDDEMIANLHRLNINENNDKESSRGSEINKANHGDVCSSKLSSSSSSPSSSMDSDSSSSISSSYDTTTSSSSSAASKQWITYKRILLGNLPTCVIFQLKRFEYIGGKVQKNVSSKVGIPENIYFYNSKAHINCCCTESKNESGDTKNEQIPKEEGSCLTYSLSGAIVYNDDVDHRGNEIDAIDTDVGHYLCYVKLKDKHEGVGRNNVLSKDQITKTEQWLKIDDDKVSPILVYENETEDMDNLDDNKNTKRCVSREKLLKMLGGIKTKSGGSWCAFILLYEYLGPCEL